MERKNNNGIFYVVISLVAVLGIGSALFAYSLSQTVNVDGDYNYYEAQELEEDINIGAVPGGDFYIPVTFHDELISNGSINISLNWAQATTSAVGNTTLVLGKYHYTGPDTLVCSGSGNDAFVYVDGVVPFTGTYRLGTTTCRTATSRACGNGTYSFTATTSQGVIAGVEVATSTATVILNADDNEGDYAREAFPLKTNDWVLVTLDFTTSPFGTSTMPVDATDGLTATGYGKISCKKSN